VKSTLCDRLGIEFPLFAFTHCRDVVAAVTNAGGMGILGAVNHTPESLEIELNWIDTAVNGKPYGVDLLIPNKLVGKEDGLTAEEFEARVPPEHKNYVRDLLEKNGIDASDLWDNNADAKYGDNYRAESLTAVMDVAFAHPIRMIVNALGVPPEYMLTQARARGILVGALTGAKAHAIKHAEAGVDVLVTSGTEAGGHCHGASDGGLYGHGRRWCLDRICLADNGGGGDHSHGEGEDAGRWIAQHRPLPQPYGKADPAATIHLDRCLACRRRA
jgi:hypothetical protein